jgi:hypothetical protein
MCKWARENFGFVFNELRSLGDFLVLDNFGLSAGVNEPSNTTQKPPILAQNPTKGGHSSTTILSMSAFGWSRDSALGFEIVPFRPEAGSRSEHTNLGVR